MNKNNSHQIIQIYGTYLWYEYKRDNKKAKKKPFFTVDSEMEKHAAQ